MTLCNIVLDASFVFKLIVPEIDPAKCLEFVTSNDYRFCAPDILELEIINGLWKKVRRKEILDGEALSIRNSYTSYFPVRSFKNKELIEPAFDILRSLNHDSIYDCLYLALALKLNCKLITFDIKFLNKTAGTNFENILITI